LPTQSEILASIAAVEARIASFAGVRSNTFSDQSVTFSLDDAHKELARLRGLLTAASGGSTTRYAATSKGV